ncbi:MAG: DUF6390 family protein [Acidimicrobiia bacterium]|nr:DUF6390 family protein [Acidimicrobiia bacterium]
MTTRPADGLGLFARYAYPPNERGYCGPDDSRTLLEYVASGVVDPDLARLAEAFAGPVPYLTVMAEATGIPDPFDRRLVEAYWVGNPILDRVEVRSFGRVLDEGFRRRMGGGWGFFEEAIPAGGVPHHSFHVLAVYPWVGLLAGGRDEPLEILDRCRIRWGRVESLDGDRVFVRSRPLRWDGRRLTLGDPVSESARVGATGLRAVVVEPGDLVSLHWDWICDRISPTAAAQLRHYTLRHLDLVNDRLDHPGPARVLG